MIHPTSDTPSLQDHLKSYASGTLDLATLLPNHQLESPMLDIRIVLFMPPFPRLDVHATDSTTPDGFVRTRIYRAQRFANPVQMVERDDVVFGTFPEFEFECDDGELWVGFKTAGILLP